VVGGDQAGTGVAARSAYQRNVVANEASNDVAAAPKAVRKAAS